MEPFCMNENNDFEKDLEIFRKEIDNIDDKIIELLDERGRIAKKIGRLKNRANMELYRPQREKYIIERMKNKSVILNSKSIERVRSKALFIST